MCVRADECLEKKIHKIVSLTTLVLFSVALNIAWFLFIYLYHHQFWFVCTCEQSTSVHIYMNRLSQKSVRIFRCCFMRFFFFFFLFCSLFFHWILPNKGSFRWNERKKPKRRETKKEWTNVKYLWLKGTVCMCMYLYDRDGHHWVQVKQVVLCVEIFFLFFLRCWSKSTNIWGKKWEILKCKEVMKEEEKTQATHRIYVRSEI